MKATFLVSVLVTALVMPRPALAYLDPGTGSYIIQIVIAGLLGAGFAVKLFWRRIKAFFSRLFSSDAGRESDGHDP